MSYKVVSQKSFVKGIVAVSNRFSIPKGAVMAALNFLMNERGALQTCDGTLIQSAIPNAIGPIVSLGAFLRNQSGGFTSKKLAIVMSPPDGANQFRIFDWDTNPATDLLGTSQPITPGWTHPQMFMFAGKMVISLGNQVALQLLDAAVPSIAAITTTPHWTADNLYQVGDRIDDGNGRTFTVASLELISTSSTSSVPTSGAGFSGHIEPAFQNITTIGSVIRDNQIVWQLTSDASAYAHQTIPFGCAHAISHAGAVWAWNTAPVNGTAGSSPGPLDGPSVIRQSTLNNPNSWPDINMAYVGKDDGQQGTGIGTFTIAEAGIAPTGSLVLFKDFSSYTVIGVFGASNFAIAQVKTDMGCIAGRTTQFCTGHGIIRLAHLGFANFDGVNDTLISEEIRPYIFGRADITGIDFANAINSRGTLVNNPPMYVCGVPIKGGSGLITRIFCYDLVMKGWMVVDVSSAMKLSAINQLRIEGVNPTTYFGDGSNAGNFKIRQWQSGDPDFDGTAIPFSVSLPEIGDPGSRAYYRRGVARLHTATPATLACQVNVGSLTQPSAVKAENPAGPTSEGSFAPNLASVRSLEGDQDVAVDFTVNATGASAQANLSGTGRVTLEGFDHHIVIKPPRPLGQRAA